MLNPVKSIMVAQQKAVSKVKNMSKKQKAIAAAAATTAVAAGVSALAYSQGKKVSVQLGENNKALETLRLGFKEIAGTISKHAADTKDTVVDFAAGVGTRIANSKVGKAVSGFISGFKK